MTFISGSEIVSIWHLGEFRFIGVVNLTQLVDGSAVSCTDCGI